MGARDQLRQAGAAARDLQEGHIGRRGIVRQGGPRRRQVVERGERTCVPRHHHMLDCRHLGADLLGQPAIVEALLARGYPETTIRAILGENLRRVFRQVLPAA